jgi:hypothetical protein
MAMHGPCITFCHEVSVLSLLHKYCQQISASGWVTQLSRGTHVDIGQQLGAVKAAKSSLLKTWKAGAVQARGKQQVAGVVLRC